MKKHNKIFYIIFIILLSFGLSACAGNTNDLNQNENVNLENEYIENEEVQAEIEAAIPVVESIELVDGLGRTVYLETPAQRIISLAPSNTEILFEIGAGAQVVGREDFSNFPIEVLDLPTVGGNYGELNTEVILSLEPDLILVAELTPQEQVQALEELGLTVYYLANPVGLDGLYENMRIVAKLAGQEHVAEIAIETLESRVEEVMAVIANAEETPVVFYELDSTDPNAPWTAGSGTFLDTLITMAAGINMGSQFEGAWVQVSAEEILAQDPTIILLGDAAWGVTPEQVAARPGWENLSAVLNEMVFAFNDDLASRPGPRLIEGLEEMAKLIHPELFD